MAAIALLGFAATGAVGGELVNISVELDGWTVLPIAEGSATKYLIATRDDNESLATDIDVVLYERVGTVWTASAYDPQVTKEDALVDIADEFGLSDPFAGEWLIDFDDNNFTGFVLPRSTFGSGFFVTDPLHEIAINLENPEPLIEGAENSGLPAGGSAINTGRIPGGNIGGGEPVTGDCGCDLCIYTSIAAGVDAFLDTPGLSIDDTELVAHDDYQVGRNWFCCIPWTWTTFGPVSSGCAPGPWVLTGSDDIPLTGGARQVKCHYSRTVTDTQTRNRIRRCATTCARLPFTQTRTRTGTQITTDPYQYTPPALPPVCPAAPAISPVCEFSTVTGTTPWTPAPPSCP